MIQKKYPATWKRKEPWKFIPRRDLFPDVELSSESNGGTELPLSQPKKSPERKFRGQNPVQKPKKVHPLPIDRPMTAVKSKRRASPEFLLLLFGGLLLLEFLESQTKGTTILGGLKKPQTIQMLKTIGPYLEDQQQDALYTAAGVMETMHMVKDVMNHTYQNQQRATIMNVPSNPSVRKVEAIKAIQPYIPSDSRRQLNHVLNFYEGANKVHRNIKAFQNNRVLNEGQKTSPLELATDILNVIRPVLPQEQRDHADKATQIIKMIEVMGAVNKGSRKESMQYALKSGNQKQRAKKPVEESPTDSSRQIEKIMDSFAPMLNDEQKESMNMIMQMAQLLSQPEQEDSSNQDGN